MSKLEYSTAINNIIIQEKAQISKPNPKTTQNPKPQNHPKPKTPPNHPKPKSPKPNSFGIVTSLYINHF